MKAKATGPKWVTQSGVPLEFTIGDRTVVIRGFIVLDDGSDQPLLLMTFDQLGAIAKRLLLEPPPGPIVVKSVTRDAGNRITGSVDRTVTVVNVGA